MKSITVALFYFLFYGVAFAQKDSSAYLTQKYKINKLLDERSNVFGQYDQSLNRRTGIFGLKTKKDMQSSNDLLRQIVLTDNTIFSELKILLDFKDFEKKEIESRAESVESYIKNYQTTITRLQKENERLKIEGEEKDKRNDLLSIYLAVLVISLIILVFYVFKLKKFTKE